MKKKESSEFKIIPRMYRDMAIGNFTSSDKDLEERTVNLSFASEVPYKRFWQERGEYADEILLIREENIYLDGLEGRANLLVNHNTDDLVGVITKISIDADRVARAKVRFGKSKRAEEVYNDVLDGIRTQVSVGYDILELRRVEEDGRPVYYVKKWRPREISLVSIAADESVGIGRANDLTTKENKGFKMKKSQKKCSEAALKEEKELTEEEVELEEEIEEGNLEETESYETESCGTKSTGISMRTESSEVSRKKMAEFLKDYPKLKSLGAEALLEGKCFEQFKEEAMELLYRETALKQKSIYSKEKEISEPIPLSMSNINQFLTQKEIRSFSFAKLFGALYSRVNNFDGCARIKEREAAFELEACREAARMLPTKHDGIRIPTEVLMDAGFAREVRNSNQRNQRVGISSTTGAPLIGEQVLFGRYIDLLMEKMILAKLGVTVLDGLVQNISIPKITSGVDAKIVDPRDGNASESAPTFTSVHLTPRSIAARVPIMRSMIVQNAIGVEGLVRDLMTASSAKLIQSVLFTGTGGNSIPFGLLNAVGVNTLVRDASANGKPLSYADIANMQREIEEANSESDNMIFVTNGSVLAQIKTTEKATGSGKFIYENSFDGKNLDGKLLYTTEAVPSNLTKGNANNLSAIFLGDWSNVILAFWKGLEILPDPFTPGLNGGLVFKLWQDFDLGFKNEKAFCVIKDVKTG